ncbi:hypothetical protein D3C76_1798090 [compost metagenome]
MAVALVVLSLAVISTKGGRLTGARSWPKNRPLPLPVISNWQGDGGSPTRSRLSRKHRVALGVELANTEIQVRWASRL